MDIGDGAQGHLGLRIAGADRIDGYGTLGQFQGQGAGQAHQGMFRGDIGGNEGITPKPGGGGDVDDPAIAPFRHGAGHRLAQQKSRLDVDFEGFPPTIQRHLGQRRGRRHAGVVDQNGDGAQVRRRPINGPGDGVRVGQVHGLNADGDIARAHQFLPRLVQAFLVPGGQGQVGAQAGQFGRNGRADAAVSPRDQRMAARQGASFGGFIVLGFGSLHVWFTYLF